MDDINDILRKVLESPADKPIDPQTVDKLCDRCPSFLLPVVLELRHPHPSLDDETARRLVERIALSVPDRRRVRILIDPEGTGRYDNFYPVMQAKTSLSTDDVIDSFLSTYGNIDPAEEALLNRMIFNPVPDYSATLGHENPEPLEPRDDQDRLLDAFIAGHTSLQPADNHQGNITANEEYSGQTTGTVSPSTEQPDISRQSKAPAGSLLSESLAKIFIKQHNYRRAYEIISSLNLNYPEKSIYFADQLRFLQKLIANQEAQEHKNNRK